MGGRVVAGEGGKRGGEGGSGRGREKRRGDNGSGVARGCGRPGRRPGGRQNEF